MGVEKLSSDGFRSSTHPTRRDRTLGQDGGEGWRKDGRSDGIGIVSINQIERLIGGNIDFLRNLPNNSVKLRLKEKVSSNLVLNSSLLADLEDSTQSSPSEIEIFDNITTGHNSVFVNSITGEIERSDSIAKTGISEISTTSISPRDISSFEIGSSEINTSYPRIAQISPRQVGFSEVGVVKFSPLQISSRQVNSSTIDFVRQTDINKVSFSSGISFQQFFDSNSRSVEFIENSISIEEIGVSGIYRELLNSPPDSHSSFMFNGVNNGAGHFISSDIVNNLNNTATNIWSNLLQPPTQLDINLQITDLPTGQLAEATITGFDENGIPNAGTIQIDHDANGVGWFVDSTPWENSEFAVGSRGAEEAGGAGGEYYFIAEDDSEAKNKYDLLTTVLHELAHLYGFIEGYSGFDNHVEGETFISENFTATLEGEHLDKEAHPHDLLNTHLAVGIRKLPSELDVRILQAILSEEDRPLNPPILGDLDRVPPKFGGLGGQLEAALTSDPLLAITNGNFSISDPATDNFGWNTTGTSNIENGQAILTEDSPFLSNFTQTFTIPESAKTLQFTLAEIELGDGETGGLGDKANIMPPDAFEVALLDANTFQPLTTYTDLTNTDSLLNIQNNGTTYFSDKVKQRGLGGFPHERLLNP